MGVLGFLLGAEVVAEVQSRAQRQRQFVGDDVARHARIAVHAVAGLRIEAFVHDEIGVVHRPVNEFHRGIGPRVVVDQASARPLVVGVVHRGADRLPEQGLQRRGVAVTADGQVVRVLAVVGHLDRRLDPLVSLAGGRDADVLRIESRIGDDPVVARILDREAELRTAAVAGIDRHAVGIGDARAEEALVPVAHPVWQPRIGIGLGVIRGVHVAHLPVDLLAELVAGVEGRNAHAGIRMLGIHGVERILVGAQAVGGMTRVDGGLAEVSGAVLILEIGPVARLVEGHRRGVGHADAPLLAAGLGRDDHGAVGGPRTVEGRRGRALEDGDALDILGVDVPGAVTVVDRGVVRLVGAGGGVPLHAVADGHAVDDEKRRIVVVGERSFAAQRHTHRSAGAGRRLVQVQTGDLSGHTAQPVSAGAVRDVVLADFRHGVPEALLLAGDTQRGHDDILDAVGRGLQGEIQPGTGPDLLRYGIESQIRADDPGLRGHGQRVFAVRAGAGTLGRTLDDQCRTDERISLAVPDDTRDPDITLDRFEHFTICRDAVKRRRQCTQQQQHTTLRTDNAPAFYHRSKKFQHGLF